MFQQIPVKKYTLLLVPMQIPLLIGILQANNTSMRPYKRLIVLAGIQVTQWPLASQSYLSQFGVLEVLLFCFFIFVYSLVPLLWHIRNCVLKRHKKYSQLLHFQSISFHDGFYPTAHKSPFICKEENLAVSRQKEGDYNKSLRHGNSVSENPCTTEITDIRDRVLRGKNVELVN